MSSTPTLGRPGVVSEAIALKQPSACSLTRLEPLVLVDAGTSASFSTIFTKKTCSGVPHSFGMDTTSYSWTPPETNRSSSYILMSSVLLEVAMIATSNLVAGVRYETACRVTLLKELAKLRWAMEDETSGATLPHLLLDESAWQGPSSQIDTYPHLWNGMKRSIVKECKDQRDFFRNLRLWFKGWTDSTSWYLHISSPPRLQVLTFRGFNMFQHVSTCGACKIRGCASIPGAISKDWKRVTAAAVSTRQGPSQLVLHFRRVVHRCTQKRWCVWGQIRLVSTDSTDLNLRIPQPSYQAIWHGGCFHMFPSYHSIGMTDFTLPCSSLRPPNTSLCSSTQEVPSPRALSTPCFEYVFLNFGTQNSVRTCVKLPYVHIYIFIDAISNQWNHITLSARKHPQMVSLLLACSHYSVSQFQRQRPKRATAPLNAKIVQYYGPQKIRHKMLQLSRIAKFRSNELCTTVIGHKRTRLNLAHLVGSPSPRLWIWPAILHHISRLSKSPQNFSPVSRKSHRARRSTNFNQSSTLGLTIYAVLTWFCSAAGNLPHQGQMIKKGKERNMSNKFKETWKTKGTRSRKRKRRKKKQQIEEQRNKRNSEQDLNWFVI